MAPTDTTFDFPVMASTVRAQFISGVQQSQKFALDAAQAMSKTTSAMPMPELPTIPGLPGIPSLEEATKFTFDFATELLNTQRDFALEMARLFTVKA